MERIRPQKLPATISITTFSRRFLSFVVVAALLQAAMIRSEACGPSYLEPVFSLEGSPDIPFQEFTGGNIGIIRPTFGRKALFIAYHYSSGGSFSSYDQEALIDALKGKPPESEDDNETVKAWVEARKLVAQEEKLPEIYTDRNSGGYNFFPNCTRNAFEVALQTLKDRAATHGTDDRNVREWLKGQDHVFDICSSGTSVPPEAPVDAPDWLKKDRQYQIAAAHFYALNFEQAIQRFELIATDNESVWQETADYLIGRTLVRQASLIKDQTKKQTLYERAELHLESVSRRSGKFGLASRQLIGLIKYRSRPKERVHELAQTLIVSGNDNLRQDLIDYTWLLDKFEGEVIAQAEKRKEEEAKKLRAAELKEKGISQTEMPTPTEPAKSERSPWEVRREALEKGEIITIQISYSVPDQTYPRFESLDVKPDATDEEIVEALERKVQRELTIEERAQMAASKSEALAERRRFLGANFRLGKDQSAGYEGNPYSDEDLTLDLIPEFLRVDDLTDWIFAFEMQDEQAYAHSVKKFLETDSPAWLMSALSKAKKNSPDVARLVEKGTKVGKSSRTFPTVTFHTARLQIELGRENEARKLLDEVLASDFSSLPVSTQNMFLELRMHVAGSLGEFLKYAGRRPVTYSLEGQYGKLKEFVESEKSYWSKEHNKESKEEYDRAVEESYRDLLPWDERVTFDEHTVDILNRHFTLDVLAQAALHPELADHLRSRMVMTVWTRALLLGRKDLLSRFAIESVKLVPELSETFAKYLELRTEPARRSEELWILIKNPQLSPFVKSGIPMRAEKEISSWEDGWWVEPRDTEYDREYKEVPKVILRPSFISAAQSDAALKERRRIVALGGAETYISESIFSWAERAPKDVRIPEALYVAAVINLQTKYGGGEQELRERAIKLLKTRYAHSPWTPKAEEEF